MNNKIELKAVNELSPYSFLIPSYQRGYRWASQEVEDLLNDINEFTPKEIHGTTDKTWYCLQPLVVRSIEDGYYEVIDGQQRLTTIYLILYYLNQDYVPVKRERIFEIEYQTRKDSKDFLNHPQENGDENIDFYYIHNAYSTIEKWFIIHSQDLNFDQGAYRSKLRFYTKVIWYEINEDNPIVIFTRLNIGKISLTNAELIRALFLNSSNFSADDETSMHLHQVEIATEWDNIEYSLQNDKLWFFLSNEQKEDNRIEYIFNLMNDLPTKETYSAFRYFNDRLHNKDENAMRTEWEMVHDYYQRFEEWFHDRELYHKIGFILTNNIVGIKKLYKESCELKKSSFKKQLDDYIKSYYRRRNLLDLDYEDKETKGVLLLYNILTMLKNDHDSSLFPFDDFKRNTWNVEHIASRKNPDLLPEFNRETWLKDVLQYIDREQKRGLELVNRVNKCLENEDYKKDVSFKLIFNDLTDYFNQYMRHDDDVDSISNLALLDESTNKSYKNAVFPVKRSRIIELDKNGGFVPICTKNVFLKYFSDYPPKISFWTQEDREAYEKDLVQVLGDYMEIYKNE